MTQRTYTVALNPEDRDTLVGRLDADEFFHYSLPFKNAQAVILDGDDDEHVPRGYVVRLSLTPDARDFYLGYMDGLSSMQTLDAPWQTDGMTELEELYTVDAFLAGQSPPLRRPGHYLPAWGTARADGTVDAQSTTTTRVLLNQWTELIRLVNMGTQGQRFKVKSAGEYELGMRILFSPEENVTFGLQATLNNGVVGDELRSDDGTASGTIAGHLNVDDLVGVAVRSSDDSTFKLLAGSMIRLKRVG